MIEIAIKKEGKFRENVIYRGSEDGFEALEFHRKCNNREGGTLTLYRSTQGFIFGGYTKIPWSSTNGF